MKCFLSFACTLAILLLSRPTTGTTVRVESPVNDVNASEGNITDVSIFTRCQVPKEGGIERFAIPVGLEEKCGDQTCELTHNVSIYVETDPNGDMDECRDFCEAQKARCRDACNSVLEDLSKPSRGCSCAVDSTDLDAKLDSCLHKCDKRAVRCFLNYKANWDLGKYPKAMYSVNWSTTNAGDCSDLE